MAKLKELFKKGKVIKEKKSVKKEKVEEHKFVKPIFDLEKKRLEEEKVIIAQRNPRA